MGGILRERDKKKGKKKGRSDVFFFSDEWFDGKNDCAWVWEW